MNEISESPEVFSELLIEKVESEFQEDPIFKQVISFSLKEEMFSNLSLLDSIDFTKHYSTKEAASFLGEGIKEYRLTNTLNKESLFPYFQVIRKGSANRYLYDWRAIWRFKMVFLLVDAKGMKLVELEKLLDYPMVSRNETREINVNSLPAKGEKVEVMIVSETLDALKKEIDDSKRSFQETIEEMKKANSQRDNELISTLKKVLIQEYTQQDKFLEKIEKELKQELKRKKRRSFLFVPFEIENPFKAMFEGMLALINEEKELLNKKIVDQKRQGNSSLTYEPIPRLRNVRKYRNVQS
ncbi:hypothetical protein [Planomicrobium okeanokoites]|uniref:hypothetical protein n=1 Tax=Planomicrobium okeanokoites TaxID=244 RepID=UPI0024912968|nr:hypothetical protein [Planomicrobium okeanokoites]